MTKWCEAVLLGSEVSSGTLRNDNLKPSMAAERQSPMNNDIRQSSGAHGARRGQEPSSWRTEHLT